MATKKNEAKKKGSDKLIAEKKLSCVCGSCEDKHPRLGGYLLIALGALLLPINMCLVPGIEWGIAWPAILIPLGIVLIAKATLCERKRSQK